MLTQRPAMICSIQPRRAVTVALLASLARITAASAQTAAPVVTQTVIPGATVLSVRVGVDITLRRADGTIETVPWATVQAQPPTTADQNTTHVQVTVGPNEAPRAQSVGPTEPFSLEPAPGFIAVDLVSTGAPLTLTPGGTVYPYFGRHNWPAVPAQYLCTTPCRLYVRPGGVGLHVGGVGQLYSEVTFVAHTDGQRVVLRAQSVGRVAGGLAATALGTGVAFGGGMLVLMGQISSSPTRYAPTIATDHTLSDIGIGMAAVGVPMMVLGIYLLATTHTGIVEDASTHLRAARDPVHFAGAGIAPTSDGTGLSSAATFTF